MLNVKKNIICVVPNTKQKCTQQGLRLSLQHEDEEEKKVFTRVLKY